VVGHRMPTVGPESPPAQGGSEILTNTVYKGILRTGELSAAGVAIDPTLRDRVQEPLGRQDAARPARCRIFAYGRGERVRPTLYG
jgi:hypothetical protein